MQLGTIKEAEQLSSNEIHLFQFMFALLIYRV